MNEPLNGPEYTKWAEYIEEMVSIRFDKALKILYTFKYIMPERTIEKIALEFIDEYLSSMEELADEQSI